MLAVLVLLQPTPVTFRQRAQLQRTDRSADQPQYLDAMRIQQAADMPVAAFVEDHFQPGVLLAVADE